jgi:hypothetical protein
MAMANRLTGMSAKGMNAMIAWVVKREEQQD